MLGALSVRHWGCSWPSSAEVSTWSAGVSPTGIAGLGAEGDARTRDGVGRAQHPVPVQPIPPRPATPLEAIETIETNESHAHTGCSASGSLAIALGLALLWVQAAAASAVSPLPASDYSVRSVCGLPAPGHARCLALELVPETPAARARTHPLGMTRSAPITPGSAAEGADGLRPQDIHSAYVLPTTAPSAQTIALIDAYNDPTAESDLKVYDEEFGLPACTTGNGCFTKLNQQGNASPLPETEGGWALEISLDIEVAHATCQNCHILLVEAESSTSEDLEAAEDSAATAGATEISNSWAGGEPTRDRAAFNHPGVVITASAGDNGYLNWDAPEANERGFVNYPASSPHVIAVGGTRLD